MEIKVVEINSYKNYLKLTQIFESDVNFMKRYFPILIIR